MSQSQRHIQIVDSDPTAALVTRLGLQARLRTEAEVSIAYARDNGQDMPAAHTIDLLIVDPGHQSQAALQLVRTLRELRPNTPVMVLTAYDSPLLRQQMQSLGVQYYLAKPIDLHDLEHVVRLILCQR